MSSSSEHSVLCGFCQAPVTKRAEGEPDGEFGCAGCDNWASRDEVLEIAKQYVVDQAGQSLTRSLRDSTRNNKFVKLTSKPTPKRQYRFITDGQL